MFNLFKRKRSDVISYIDTKDHSLEIDAARRTAYLMYEKSLTKLEVSKDSYHKRLAEHWKNRIEELQNQYNFV